MNGCEGSQLENDSEVFIVHSSYGNETFESVLRQVIIVKKSMCPAAYRIIELFNAHQVNCSMSAESVCFYDEIYR
jgi:hypothetical protein